MSRIAASVCSLALAMTAVSTPAIAQGDPAKKTQTAKTFWGVSAEKFEYRYSDSDEELAVIEGGAFYGTDELEFHWLFEGDWEEAHHAWKTLQNRFVAKAPVDDFSAANAGIRIDTTECPDRVYGQLRLTSMETYVVV